MPGIGLARTKRREIDMSNYPVRQMNEEKREKIRDLWRLGLSSSEIANEVGLSRNSVIGAVHRMRQNGVELDSRQNKKSTKTSQQINIVITKKIEEKTSEPVDIMGLGFFSCRYIIKEGNVFETRYCNNKIHNASYCKEHYKLCYYPAKNQGKIII